MKLCFVVDGRSQHARNWITYFTKAGDEVHILSTFPCDPLVPPARSLQVIPLDFSARIRASSIAGNQDGAKSPHGSSAIARWRGGPLWRQLARIRDQVAPTAVQLQKIRVRKAIGDLKPDLVHAMRIPFEGILASQALWGSNVPLVVSIWGNDFTLFAQGSSVIAGLTRATVKRADGLHPDCEKDLKLGWQWGFDKAKPAAVLPGGAGIKTSVFRPGPKNEALAGLLQIEPGAPVIINPRGVKSYIRTDTFFQAIPHVLRKFPNAVFLGAMMAGNTSAQAWVSKLSIQHSVRLLPYVAHDEMADYFRLADITVSPAEHDGTPNTLLEAMACGTFPVAGDIPSVREWITSGENGLLFDAADPVSMAKTLIQAVTHDDLRARAARDNPKVISARVDHESVMERARIFYGDVIRFKQSAAS